MRKDQDIEFLTIIYKVTIQEIKDLKPKYKEKKELEVKANTVFDRILEKITVH
jgi:hypothetical protein